MGSGIEMRILIFKSLPSARARVFIGFRRNLVCSVLVFVLFTTAVVIHLVISVLRTTMGIKKFRQCANASLLKRNRNRREYAKGDWGVGLEGLVSGLVITCVRFAPICPALVDTINWQTHNSPDLKQKFRNLEEQSQGDKRL